jgi:RNA polymerase sigma-70 factor (ECF subfamily)
MTTDLDGGDSSLVERARRGDVDAFERLYRETAGRIHALCLRMTGHQQLAEELTQESFLRAWKKLSGFRGESAFGTWVHRIAVNVVLGHLRSHARSAERRGVDTDPSEIDPPRDLEDTGTRLDLERAIAALPERARVVFILHDVEGFRHRDIAGMTGMAVGTSKAHLSRARSLLRKALRR